MGLKRILVGLGLGFFCIAPGCANVVGLGDFTVAGSGGEAVGKVGNSSGAPNSGGTGGTAGQLESSAGANNGAQAGLNADAGSGADAGAAGAAGAAGTPALQCATNCDDQNECTDDSCVDGKCVNASAGAGKTCGTGLTCDAQGVCVRCRDTAAGTAKDEGCTTGAPICVGSGATATCSGCTTSADCNDGNDCTTETCSNGSCAFLPVAAGQACATGVCNGISGSEKCVACADDAAVGKKDSGCTAAAKPICDTSGTPACVACVVDADCNDSVSCTNDKCTNHVCSNVTDDSKCTLSLDACNPNRCDAKFDCKPVMLTLTTSPLISANTTVGNGSFAAVTVVKVKNHEADLWDDTGDDYVIYSCPCASTNGTTGKNTGDNNYAAWFGGTADAHVDELSQVVTLPVGTTTVHFQADTNVQTASTAVTNHDSFDMRVYDSSQVQIGGSIATLTNVTGQTGVAVAWKPNGIDNTVDLSAHAGEQVSIDLSSNVDGALNTDFFIDNVRVTATVCN
ncbi:MAG: hypothetical protein ABI548_05885 [Polyangiaceae bacterium]